MKICKKCSSIEFYADGRCKACTRVCNKAWQKANPELHKASCAAWRIANPELQKMRCAAWEKANPERRRANSARWRANNPERIKELTRIRYEVNSEQIKAASVAWRAANPEKRRAAYASWKKSNPEARRILQQNRDAIKKNVGGKLSQGLAAKLFKLQRGRCACCRNPIVKYHLDHRMPLALGGLNTDDNIQLLCPTCNLQKHAKHPIDFMQSKGYLL